MNKEELLNFLLNKINYFKNVELEDFCLLNSLESDELGLMNENVFKVTPLLKQISDYALIYSIINEEELEELAACIDDEEVLEEIIEVIEACSNYVEILQQENCYHPSVLINSDIQSSITLYSEFDGSICDLMELIDGETNDDVLLDSSKIAIDDPQDKADLIFETLKINIRSGEIVEKEDILLGLLNYSMEFIDIVLTTSKNKQIAYQGNCYFDISENDRFPSDDSISLLEVLENQILILNKVKEYEDDSFEEDEEVKETIQNILEAYELYKGYKYRFLKDSYKESKILAKCKKL